MEASAEAGASRFHVDRGEKPAPHDAIATMRGAPAGSLMEASAEAGAFSFAEDMVRLVTNVHRGAWDTSEPAHLCNAPRNEQAAEMPRERIPDDPSPDGTNAPVERPLDHFFQLVLMDEEGRREWEAQQQENTEEAERVRKLGAFRAELLRRRHGSSLAQGQGRSED